MVNLLKKFVLRDLVLEIKDIRSLELLKNVHSEFIPWTGASIHPTALLYVLNDITIHRRKNIVECGSGISTIYVAGLIKGLNADIKFQSIDHDENWLSILSEHLQKNDLQEHVDLIHAPLAYCQHCVDKSYQWYDPQVLDQKVTSEPIDLLFVDGPPAKSRKCDYSRYPALAYFRSNLAEKHTVILDDACRKGEMETASKWEKEFGLKFKQEILKGDILISETGGQYNVL
jgi:predicted O-methyltransferase YrrM